MRATLFAGTGRERALRDQRVALRRAISTADLGFHDPRSMTSEAERKPKPKPKPKPVAGAWGVEGKRRALALSEAAASSSSSFADLMEERLMMSSEAPDLSIEWKSGAFGQAGDDAAPEGDELPSWETYESRWGEGRRGLTSVLDESELVHKRRRTISKARKQFVLPDDAPRPSPAKPPGAGGPGAVPLGEKHTCYRKLNRLPKNSLAWLLLGGFNGARLEHALRKKHILIQASESPTFEDVLRFNGITRRPLCLCHWVGREVSERFIDWVADTVEGTVDDGMNMFSSVDEIAEGDLGTTCDGVNRSFVESVYVTPFLREAQLALRPSADDAIASARAFDQEVSRISKLRGSAPDDKKAYDLQKRREPWMSK